MFRLSAKHSVISTYSRTYDMSVWEVVTIGLIVIGSTTIVMLAVDCIRRNRNDRLREVSFLTNGDERSGVVTGVPDRVQAPMSTHPPPGCAVVESPDKGLSLAWAV